jgi:hypothetical protein
MLGSDRQHADDSLDLTLAQRRKASLGKSMWPLVAGCGRSGAWFLCLPGSMEQSSSL